MNTKSLKENFNSTKRRVANILLNLITVIVMIIGLFFSIPKMVWNLIKKLLGGGKRSIKSFGSKIKKNKATTALVIALAVAIAIILWMYNHPKTIVETEYVETIKEVLVEGTENNEEEAEEASEEVATKATSKKLTDAQREASADLKDQVEVSAQKSEEKVEGETSANSEDIIANDEKAAEAVENIVDAIEEEKIAEELEDENKKIVSDADDKATVIGDDNTGSNNNTVVPEEEVTKKPFEDTEKVESSKATEEVEEATEEVEETSNGAYNLFPEEETEEATEEVAEEVVEEGTTVEENNTVLVPEDNKVETTTVVAEVEEVAQKAAKLNTSYVVASKDATAVITIEEGEVVSADAGQGVIVEVVNNTVRVSLENIEDTIVDVDMVDSLGNSINAMVSFN